MKKHLLSAPFMLTLFGFCIIVIACSKSPTLWPTQPVGDTSDIENVSVSKPDEIEIDQLTTISKLPADACTETEEGKVCSINTSQVIKWGWGFCESDEATLRTNVPNAQVELIVNNIRIPDNLIYQRDETYDRQNTPYCHTWSIKLSNWQSGSTIRLENRATAGKLDPQHNVFVIHVK